MEPGNGRRRLTRFGYYAAVLFIAAAVLQIQRYSAPFFSSPSDSPSQWQQTAIQVASETTALLITLGTALLGGLGLLLGSRGSDSPKPRYLWCAFSCAMASGLSLYFGYVVHLRVLWMVTSKTFDPTSDFFVIPSQGQFYALLVGAFFFGIFAVHNLRGEK